MQAENSKPAGSMTVKNAMLVSLNISVWQANRHDKKISDGVTTANAVKDARMGRFWKSLLPKCAVIDRMYAAQRAARTFHYDNTLEWMHDGPRVLPTANFVKYKEAMRGYKDLFERAVLDLVAQYDDIKTDASIVLGGLYNEIDYPSKEELTKKYGFSFNVMTMPAVDGLLQLDLEAEDAEELRETLEADMRGMYKRANEKLWADLHARLKTLTEKLEDPDAYVRDDTIAGVRDLAELLPRLNVTNDEQLDMLSNRLKESLASISATSVKTNPSTRQRVAEETKTVFNVMQAFMGPRRSGAGGTKAAPASAKAPKELKRAA